MESVRIDLPTLALVAAARVAAPVAPPDAGDAELDGLDELDGLELDELEDVLESLLQAAATSSTALMRRSEARFILVLTGGGRCEIAGMARNAQVAGAGRRMTKMSPVSSFSSRYFPRRSTPLILAPSSLEMNTFFV